MFAITPMIKTQKGIKWNHNQSALKIHNGQKFNHNETVLKIRKGFRYNHNETLLKIRKGYKWNHNETVLNIRKGFKLNHNEISVKNKKEHNMSTIQTILERMMNEPSFAKAVFTDAAKALSEYSLSTEELAKFQGLSPADFNVFASASPEERKSFGLAGGGIANNRNVLWGDYFIIDPSV